MSLTDMAINRRQFVLGTSSAMVTSPLLAKPQTPNAHIPNATLGGTTFDLVIDYQTVNFTGQSVIANTVNQSLPGPTLYWREGDTVRLRVTNKLTHESSIHWHGIILPSAMDGTPGLSFAGIKPGESFEYQFDVKQNGTYWYHSHSAFQEQTGLLGAIVIQSREPEPVTYDREYVVLLSDWSDEAPERVYAKLKKMSHYYNFRERTLADTWRDIRNQGFAASWRNNAMWNQMRMSRTDIADVTGYTYTYLMNGISPITGWTGEFKAGEKIRLRFINGAAMTLFDVRIPGLKMTVVAADGQWVKPVEVDEFRMGTAETYDVIVEPKEGAYTLFAQSIDRTGYAWGTLTSDPVLKAIIPAMDPAPVLSHQDMGMGAMDHSGHGNVGGHDKDNSGHGMDHSAHQMHHGSHHIDHTANGMAEMDHSAHQMGQAMEHSRGTVVGARSGEKKAPSLTLAGFGSNFGKAGAVVHPATETGPVLDMQAEAPESGLADPGIGLRQHARRYQRKVLTYADLKNLYPTRDKRQPSREITLHLTGNMRRYMWSLDGVKFMDAEPLVLQYGERVRIVLINDTMMTHPIHLHGLWSELETGDPDYIPRKHTILVQPGSKISYLVTADALGRWAYHCHLMYHMPGMMREVRVIGESL